MFLNRLVSNCAGTKELSRSSRNNIILYCSKQRKMKIIPLNLDSVLFVPAQFETSLFPPSRIFYKVKKHKILQYEYEKLLYALFVQKATFGLHIYL